jgi:methionyl-tRNA formyltransferase
MVEALARLEQGTLVEMPQPEEGATYAPKIIKSETHIDFNRKAQKVLDHIHGLSPSPGAWCSASIGDKPQRLKILKAQAVTGRGSPAYIIDDDFTIACDEGAIRPLVIQREGKAAMPRDEFLRGSPLKPGDRLG